MCSSRVVPGGPTPYDGRYFDEQVEGSLASARVVAPLVQRLVAARSVVDFGCGRAAWLKAFREAGAETVLGLDGPYVDRGKLLIGGDEFRAAELARPVSLGRTYDLAVCLEVAEHLPSSSSHHLVHSLTSAAPVVLFSAAVPGQGGTDHVNEQWPEYWDGLFEREGFQRLDPIRPLIWRDARVEIWYRQNIYLYASGGTCKALSDAALAGRSSEASDLEIIDRAILRRFKSFRGLISATLSAGSRALALRLSRPGRGG